MGSRQGSVMGGCLEVSSTLKWTSDYAIQGENEHRYNPRTEVSSASKMAFIATTYQSETRYHISIGVTFNISTGNSKSLISGIVYFYRGYLGAFPQLSSILIF
jgi:hypothetical protein